MFKHYEELILEHRDLTQRYRDLIARYENVNQTLAEAKRELDLLNSNKLVSMAWAADYLGVSEPQVLKMMEEEKIFLYGKLKRLFRSSVIAFAKRYSVTVNSYQQYKKFG